uniref:Hypothetical LAGLIDADG homing endonuclease n=1 Tax=Neochloris aquatica TaxID=3099 RepID=A0A076VF47_9CHLO|nr:hypothetical LAGLIDADG homing endonuclease [Neochloris aquatica]AIK29163.1 hypothetical LAGLIDADG homing endonuclease [Neochloris aquatica]
MPFCNFFHFFPGINLMPERCADFKRNFAGKLISKMQGIPNSTTFCCFGSQNTDVVAPVAPASAQYCSMKTFDPLNDNCDRFINTPEHLTKKFNFSEFKTIENQKFSLISDCFLEWFVGFVEGEGSFTVCNRNKDLVFCVVQSLLDKDVLYYIQKTLGFGRVQMHSNKNNQTWAYKVTNLSDLYKIILILNGNVLLAYRQKQLQTFIEAFNEKIERKHNKKKVLTFGLKKIHLLFADFFPTLNDLWTSGFCDREGGFYLYFINHTSTYKISFQVTQKHAVNLPVLSSFIQMFKQGRIELKKKLEFYTFVITGLGNCKNAVEYFDKFPLFTSKKANSLAIFKELIQCLWNGDHRQHNGALLPQLILKAKIMNKYKNKNKEHRV